MLKCRDSVAEMRNVDRQTVAVVMPTLIYLTAGISVAICIGSVENLPDGYELTTLFPFLFGMLYFTLLSSVRISASQTPITINVFLAIQWLRYVATPALIALGGELSKTPYLHPRAESVRLASILMLIELVAGLLYVRNLALRGNGGTDYRLPNLLGDRLVYACFIGLSLGVLVFARADLDLNFFALAAGTGRRAGDSTETVLVILRQVVTVGGLLLFVWLISACAPRYQRTKNPIYYLVPLVAALLNVSTIVGERRAAQVYVGFCSIWILLHAYPTLKKWTVASVGGIAVIVVALLSIYKFFYAFEVQSYGEALQGSAIDVGWWAEMLQIYFAGPQDLGVAIDFAQSAGLSIWDLVYDLLRSTVPISFLVKGQGTLVSTQFNDYIFGGMQHTGHIVSTGAYGYLFFGLVGSWVFLVANLVIAAFAERRMWSARSLGMTYVWGFVMIRVAFNVTFNTSDNISSATITLASAGLLFAFGEFVRLRSRPWLGRTDTLYEGTAGFVRERRVCVEYENKVRSATSKRQGVT